MEASNLMACDRAFGRLLTECVWKSRLKSMRKEEFDGPPPKDRIFRGDNDDPMSFLQKLAKSYDDKKINLPVIGYFRDAGFSFDPLNALDKPKKIVFEKEIECVCQNENKNECPCDESLRF